MSHRRGAGAPKEPAIQKEEEIIPFSQSLDSVPSMGIDRETATPTAVPTGAADAAPAGPLAASGSSALSLDARYETERKELKLKQWKEGPFAAGFTEGTWDEEYQSIKANPKGHFCDDRHVTNNDGAFPCVGCSALFCRLLGATRIGNMAILKQSQEWVEEEEVTEEGETKVKRFTRPKLEIVVGPYWPMLCLVTYPLIFGVSIATLVTAIPHQSILMTLIWAICTIGLITALGMTAFRDPGILPRYLSPPPNDDGGWRWSDRAHSYRPRGAFFDPDTAVIVEEFDHTCPWTGTAIGAKNMRSFQCFVALVFLCLMLDIVLLTGGIIR